MKQLFITFICHCEKIWWDKGYDSLITVINTFLNMQKEASLKLGYPITSTFCTLIDHPNKDRQVPDISFVPDLFKQIISSGNEVGLHVHGPIQEMKAGFQDRLINRDAQLLNKFGIKPVTYVAGDWITSQETVSALEQAGFRIDCSVYNLEPLHDKFGVNRNYRKRKNLRPYHPDYSDICSDGKSKIIELPVSGYFLEFIENIYPELPAVTERISKRYQELNDIDIFQIFWHPFDLVTLNGKTSDELQKQGLKPEAGEGKIGININALEAIRGFLLEFGNNPDIKITSARSSVTEYLKSEKV